jgi:hypothetical protein
MRQSNKLGIVGGALAALLALALPASGAPSLPDEASDSAVEHTHGPDGLKLDPRGKGAAAAPYEVDDKAPWLASDYPLAGTGLATDQTPDYTRGRVQTSLPTFHAVYMYASGQPNRFSQFAAMFQADAHQAEDRLLSLFGRSVRFDYLASGQLDISVVQSRNNSKKLASGQQFSLVSNELTQRGFTNPSKKYIVWLDAGSQACGQGSLYQDTRRSAANYNDTNRTTAIVYRPYTTTDPLTGGFCRGRTLLHEMGHNMGAIQRVAPHAFDGAHCNDSAEDVMCYTSATSNDTGGYDFDYNNDDYWDAAADPTPSNAVAKLGWWTVNLSKYVCPTTGCENANSSPGY